MAQTTNEVSTMKNIDLKIRGKERFTINGDPNRFIELNTGDVGVTSRFAAAIPQFNDCIDRIDNLEVTVESTDSLVNYNKNFEEINTKLKELVDYVFDTEVSDVCCSSGSMFDSYDGKFRFEEILETLIDLYNGTIAEETKKIQKRMKSHTDKYVPQDRKRKS